MHLPVEVDPPFGVHQRVKRIQGRSSRLLRQALRWYRPRLPSLWTHRSFVCTVGGVPLEIVQQAIGQPTHV
ncbi:transposase OrfA [mine drainage metagenome]|uniref:Transposase OrfA n=1 Tax=mine drainage metagenome TaxID=410659 RepID=T0ZBZ3_9ZZZZ